MDRYAGKNVVITGGTHGIGMATARAVRDGGGSVLVTGLNEENIGKAQAELGTDAHVVRSDARDLTEIAALGDRIATTFDAIDFLFVNVGHIRFAPLADVSEDVYDTMFDTNTKGAFFTAQRLAPLMRDGGAIVFTTAVADHLGFVATSVGTGMKAAIRAFVRVFAAEMAPRGIRVNAVSPGFTQTETMGIAYISEELRAANQSEGEEMTPLGRFGRPEEVAAAALFLAFDATFTTGAELPVDGGLGQGLESPHTPVVVG